MYRSGCPVTNVLDLIGDRWSLVIIRDLFMGRKTFKEFLSSPEGIATNILSSRLQSLLNHGLINYTFSPKNKKLNITILKIEALTYIQLCMKCQCGVNVT